MILEDCYWIFPHRVKRGVFMASFKEIVGHEDIITHFKKSMERGKVSHAYILNGEKDSGKKLIAKVVAKTLQCELGETDPCEECHSCIQVESGNQPDIIWVTHEKPNVISVDEIREQINNDIGIRPYSSRYKIYIIADAQLMNQQAQNAILKTIEEPPEYAIIMLLTTNIDKFLPTILSRCIILNCKPIKELDMIDYLINVVGVDEKKAYFCTNFAMGNMGKAVRLAISEDYNNLKNDCTHILKNIYDMSIEDIIDQIKKINKYKLEINDFIDMMIMWYRDILMLKISGNPNKLLFKEEYIYIKKQASRISYAGVDQIIEALEKVKTRLDANVNFDITMELMLLTIKEN